ncbi:hypothetical protein ACFFNY_20210 [Paenibacillus hodogayensis]|uniref:Aminoglycoside phosphotransferase domain-containing protein n=1 Tax=Paenibacillus hodogayensis TaxID=279208 RepID=A0ABV5W009_9BACL
MKQLLHKAIGQYGLNPDRLSVEQEIQSDSWHGDLHFKVRVDDHAYSARLMREKRYETDVFVQLTDEVLTEQIRFGNYLVQAGIPFMNHVPTSAGELFTRITEGDKAWRVVLFQWMEGKHITCCTEQVAEKFGSFAQVLHNLSAKFETAIFPKKSHIEGLSGCLNWNFTAKTIELLKNKEHVLLQEHIDRYFRRGGDAAISC